MEKREIALSTPNLNADIVENLKECIEEGWISTSGRFIGEFEEKVSSYIGMEDAVACQSGTAGLHTALRILDVGAGDAVLVPTLTFIAAVNPVRYQGAEPIFLDCDKGFCLDPVKLRQFCAAECRLEDGRLIHNKTGRTIKAIIPVHIFGNLSDMEAIMEIAQDYSLKVIEDATEALGSFWIDGAFAGQHAGTVGHIGVFSFNANKIITTGGGGMIVSPDSDILRQARYLTTTAKDDGLFFAHNEVGYNYRMLNIQAALGVSQIDELPDFIQTKIANYWLYWEFLSETPGIRLLPFRPGTRPNHWFYALYVDDLPESAPGETRNRLMARLIEEGIQCRPVWKLNHTQTPYVNCTNYLIEQAEDYEKHILNLPCSTNLVEADVRYICEKLQKALASLSATSVL
ncbi:MAG: LegC family aminotransferase [Clostridiales Family XIII bacterium]|jgi:aminotransferase in exopolysaccharide biosynthesis|nr:LegC family aminotransferase [Clostridiales Family XIII bacterium]